MEIAKTVVGGREICKRELVSEGRDIYSAALLLSMLNRHET